eukprot:GDKH01029210.1.p1 GENE.GDKH01029210.1~~GDKH01029210.1.p1  ORF type:complete len:193 (+),score=47.27 GDKH01029210.1:109-687(+)
MFRSALCLALLAAAPTANADVGGVCKLEGKRVYMENQADLDGLNFVQKAQMIHALKWHSFAEEGRDWVALTSSHAELFEYLNLQDLAMLHYSRTSEAGVKTDYTRWSFGLGDNEFGGYYLADRPEMEVTVDDGDHIPVCQQHRANETPDCASDLLAACLEAVSESSDANDEASAANVEAPEANAAVSEAFLA